MDTPRPLPVRLCFAIATGFGSGLAGAAPGTWGSLAALAAWSAAKACGGLATPLTEVLLAAAIFLSGTAATAVVLREEARAGRAGDDPQFVVIDEWLGMSVALFGAGLHSMLPLYAFVFFRIFDISKLPPANWLERVPGAWGVMLDDLAAGLWAYGALTLIRIYIPSII